MHRLVAATAAWLLCIALASPAQACDASDEIPGAGGRYLLLAEGDSITFGAGSDDGAGSYAPRACVPRLSGIAMRVGAVSGATLGSDLSPPGANSLYGRLMQDNAMLAGMKGKRIAILSILIGRNDLAGFRGGADAYAQALGRYVARMRQAGWDRVIVGTLLPSTYQAFMSSRARLNAILTAPGWARAHGIDAIADFARLPDIGSPQAAERKDLFVDGTHPTNEGYAAMVPAYDRALKAVIAR